MRNIRATMREARAAVLGLLLFGAASALAQTPVYQVDAAWPRDLPNDWIIGQVSGLAVGPDDTVWIVQRPRSISASEAGAVQSPPLAECCVPAPSVLQFDSEGTLLRAWGGPVWDIERQSWDVPEQWPGNEHGIFVDGEGFVWLAGNGPEDDFISKYSPEGELLLIIGGGEGEGGSNDPGRLGRPADIYVDVEAREVFVGDGYGNRRVIVFNSDSGEYKRHWGAYGGVPDDGPLPAYTPGMPPAEQFLGPVHAVEKGPDGNFYVADRASNRIQVFTRDGDFLREAMLAPATLGDGAIWDLTFSPYDDGRWLFVADGQNMKVWILERESLEPAGAFGRGGRQAGQFDWVHNIAADSAGNVYTAEVNNGRRVQKFARVE